MCVISAYRVLNFGLVWKINKHIVYHTEQADIRNFLTQSKKKRRREKKAGNW